MFGLPFTDPNHPLFRQYNRPGVPDRLDWGWFSGLWHQLTTLREESPESRKGFRVGLMALLFGALKKFSDTLLFMMGGYGVNPASSILGAFAEMSSGLFRLSTAPEQPGEAPHEPAPQPQGDLQELLAGEIPRSLLHAFSRHGGRSSQNVPELAITSSPLVEVLPEEDAPTSESPLGPGRLNC